MKISFDWSGRMRSLLIVATLTVVFFVGFAMGNQRAILQAQGNTGASSEEVARAFEAFWQTFNLIQDQYIDDVPLEVLAEGATTGMVEALDDPFSGYMNPETFDNLNSDLSGEFEGIGVVIHTIEDTGEIEVIGLLKGAPAQGAGILPGDIFTIVDGTDVTNVDQSELAVLVRGPEGTPVNIIMRRGTELIDFEIVRARITVPNVESEILDDNIGYIRMNQFSPTARQDLDAALNEIEVNDRDGLIFDLRDNPGGLLSTAIEISSAFIESGTVVIEAFSDDNERVYEANGNFANIDVPIVVLVNEASASASELVAGALQDAGVATIMGEVTFGKGTVQQWLPLVNDGGVRLTIARWLTPERRWIHDQGVTPDIIIDWQPMTLEDYEGFDDPQILAALAQLTGEPIVFPVPEVTESP